MRDRVLDLARNGLPDDKIAATLTGEGHRSPKGLSPDNRITCQVALERRCSSIRHGSWQAGC
jgi:hypothetical protein